MCDPPEANTPMYCLPFFPCQLTGTEFTSMPTSVTHSSAPVFESKARNFPSMVAPTNTRPPAVAMDPPLVVGVPVFGTPSLSSSANEPRGTRHAMSPVFTFTATISPQGGWLHGHCLVPSQK